MPRNHKKATLPKPGVNLPESSRVCSDCGKTVQIGDWVWCPHGKPGFYVHSGNKIWVGNDAIFGKDWKKHEDRIRVDTEAEMIGP